MRAAADTWLAAASSTALGLAGVLALAGALSGDLLLLVASALLGGTGALVLVAGGWVEPIWLVIASLPLPALYATEGGRLSPILLVGTVAVVGWLVRRALDRRPLVPAARAVRPFLFVAVAVLLAAIFAADAAAAAREVLNFALLVGLLALTLDRISVRPARARTLAWWVAVAAALAGAAAVPEALGMIPTRFRLAGTGWFRAAGGFGWPNELAMFLAISFPFAVHAVRTSRGPALVVAVGALALTALGLASTFSRGSWLSVSVAPVILLLVGEHRLALRFWTAALLGAVTFDLLSGGAIVARIAATAGDVLVAQRLLLTLAGLMMLRAHPLFGVGPGGFSEGLDEVGLLVPGLFDFVDSAQNGYVHMAAEAGVMGLAALLFFMGWTLLTLARSARAAVRARPADPVDRSLRTAVVWSFTTACIVSLFEWPFAHGVGELIVVVAALGLAIALPRSAAA